jgi:multidrug efflux pump subunit AcrA (membrane-fusion protein)
VGTESFIWVLREKRVERRAVSVGPESDGKVEALAGVNPGDELVSPVIEGLEDGGKVKIKDSDS